MGAHYLSLCAIAKDEHDYLPEFVAYYLALGVERFCVFDNDSQVPVRETLRPVIAAGLAEVIDLPGANRQMVAYNRALDRYRHATRWMIYCDVDEFIVPRSVETLPALLAGYEDHAGLAVSWLLFGTSGHRERPPGLAVESYTHHLGPHDVENTHVKSIVQPSRTLGAFNPHYFLPQPGGSIVNEDCAPVIGAFAPPRRARVQMNHYYTRSAAEFALKIARGRALAGPPRTMDDLVDIDRRCTAEDRTIQRFVPQVREVQARYWG